ncbi:MAG: metal-dependent transcriptional regulator [Erysipelotrichaceae bacterium]|nr:metal-dependent transcriptional regulator [Erysipelotrichaceae bacterium]
MTMKESGEMYLETILILEKRNGTVRSVDIAHEMNFSKAAISRAMTRLKNDEYVSFDDEGFVKLTAKGKKIATKIYERHNVLSEFLMGLGVKEKTAIEDACKIEHDISDETFKAIKKTLKK